MALVDSPWHVINAVIVFFLGVLIATLTSKYFKVTLIQSLSLYLWHTILCFVYLFYAITYGADSTHYFNKAGEELESWALGTEGVIWLVAIFRVLDISLVGVFLIFNIFGYIGLLALYGSLYSVVKNTNMYLRYLALLIVYLPSASFWSSAIGKDALSFMAIGLALWSALEFDKRKVLMIIAVLIMLYVRPHIAGMMIIALSFSTLIQGNIPAAQRILLGIISVGATAVMIPFALNYAGVSTVSSGGVQSYIETRQQYNVSGGGGIDIASMSLPGQLFTYLFRPLPYEAHSIPALASSLDNLVLLYLAILGIKVKIRMLSNRAKLTFSENRAFMWSYVILAWFTLAMTTANLGISVRQKWMFTPVLLFLIISLLAKVYHQKVRKTYV